MAKPPFIETRPAPSTPGGLAKAEAACRACPLWRGATQAVPGEGPTRAALMLVGEQPGDQEDRVGKPFVGPAGRMLDEALAAADIDRESVFMTNAVKHFKNEPRGKRRLHKRPNASEIDICRWWLAREIRAVRPRLIVALGATAARGVMGYAGALGAIRGSIRASSEGVTALATIHPSFLLRIRDPETKAAEMARFTADLARARAHVA